MPVSLHTLKPYIPAQDFERSKAFYQALGFTPSEGWGGTADFEMDGQHFRLQDYYVKDWADNCMIVIAVPDIDAWHLRAREVVSSGRYAPARYTPPEPVDDARVLHVWDPSGVLLVFVQ